MKDMLEKTEQINAQKKDNNKNKKKKIDSLTINSYFLI